jgi:hypothetical protein
VSSNHLCNTLINIKKFLTAPAHTIPGRNYGESHGRPYGAPCPGPSDRDRTPSHQQLAPAHYPGMAHGYQGTVQEEHLQFPTRNMSEGNRGSIPQGFQAIHDASQYGRMPVPVADTKAFVEKFRVDLEVSMYQLFLAILLTPMDCHCLEYIHCTAVTNRNYIRWGSRIGH